MPSPKSKDRVSQLLATARRNPEFAQRVAARLPEQLRLEFTQELCKPDVAGEKVTPLRPARPGLRKCRRPQAPQSGLAAQLSLFARSVARVS